MLTPQEERSYAMWCHLASLAAMLGVPFGNILGPFIVWQMKGKESAFVDVHGKESMNFQLSFMVYTLAAAMLGFLIFFLVMASGLVAVGTVGSTGEPGAAILLPFIFGSGFFLPVLGIMALSILDIVLSIIAGMKAYNGEHYRYPGTIRFLR